MTIMLEPTVTLDSLEAWAQSLYPSVITGRACFANACPVRNYVQSVFNPRSVTVMPSEMKYYFDVGDDDFLYGGKPHSREVKKLIMKIDSEHTYEDISAETLLRLIQEVREDMAYEEATYASL